jgi:ketosteroid isomerase-like protein
VLHIRDGKVTRLVMYEDRDRALADLGLEEQTTAEEPTTPDLEEAVRRLIDALSRREFDALVAMFAPDAVWDPSSLGLGGPFEGRKTIRRVLQDWYRAFEDGELVLEEFHDLGGGVGFAVVFERDRPTGSSEFVGLRMAVVGAWANGLIERFATYTDTDQARTAAERLADGRRSVVPGGSGSGCRITASPSTYSGRSRGTSQ